MKQNTAKEKKNIKNETNKANTQTHIHTHASHCPTYIHIHTHIFPHAQTHIPFLPTHPSLLPPIKHPHYPLPQHTYRSQVRLSARPSVCLSVLLCSLFKMMNSYLFTRWRWIQNSPLLSAGIKFISFASPPLPPRPDRLSPAYQTTKRIF